MGDECRGLWGENKKSLFETVPILMGGVVRVSRGIIEGG